MVSSADQTRVWAYEELIASDYKLMAGRCQGESSGKTHLYIVIDGEVVSRSPMHLYRGYPSLWFVVPICRIDAGCAYNTTPAVCNVNEIGAEELHCLCGSCMYLMDRFIEDPSKLFAPYRIIRHRSRFVCGQRGSYR